MRLTPEEKEQLDTLGKTALSQYSINIRQPANLAQLLSLARSEFIVNGGNSGGKYMIALEKVFRLLGSNLFRTEFRWSEYNKTQWLKFCDNSIGIEGGACMFSFEPDGELPAPLENRNFRGVGLGKPLGLFPYELFPIFPDKQAQLSATIDSIDFQTLA